MIRDRRLWPSPRLLSGKIGVNATNDTRAYPLPGPDASHIFLRPVRSDLRENHASYPAPGVRAPITPAPRVLARKTVPGSRGSMIAGRARFVPGTPAPRVVNSRIAHLTPLRQCTTSGLHRAVRGSTIAGRTRFVPATPAPRIYSRSGSARRQFRATQSRINDCRSRQIHASHSPAGSVVRQLLPRWE